MLTTVPARRAALGLLRFVSARLLTTLAVPTFEIAVQLSSPTTVLTVALAVTKPLVSRWRAWLTTPSANPVSRRV